MPSVLGKDYKKAEKIVMLMIPSKKVWIGVNRSVNNWALSLHMQSSEKETCYITLLKGLNEVQFDFNYLLT